MRRLLRWLLGRDDPEPGEDERPEAEPEAAEPAEEPEQEEEQAESAYSPPAAHARILMGVRRDAEADAVRHAEDMLDRQFPITARAEATAGDRLAALRAEFVRRDTELRESAAARTQEIAAAANRLAAIQAALRQGGIPADQMHLEPIQARNLSGWRIVVALVVGSGSGYLIAAGNLSAIWLGLVIALALAIIVALFAAPPEDIEEEAIASLRRSHTEVDARLTELNSRVARIEIEREALRGSTRTLAEGEVALARRIAAEYASAAFSAMPAGSLEGGREFASQREPDVELPDWVAELEVVA